jgi:hypothetical protein
MPVARIFEWGMNGVGSDVVGSERHVAAKRIKTLAACEAPLPAADIDESYQTLGEHVRVSNRARQIGAS